MKYIFVSDTVTAEEREMLSAMGDVVVLPRLLSLPAPISSHPDTLFAHIGGRLFTFADYTAGAEMMKSRNINVQTVSSPAGDAYPLDAALNCFEAGGVTFGREKSLAKEIISASAEIEDVRQGYAHCASAVFPCGIISSDDGIIKAASRRGVNTLKIAAGNISLEGYGCGFIGGACAYIGGKAVFFGDLKTHPSGDKIKEFLFLGGIDAVSLSGGVLRDCGSALVIGDEP